LKATPEQKVVVGRAELSAPGAPKQLHLKLRLPPEHAPHTVTVNGRKSDLAGSGRDTVIIDTAGEKSFEVVAHHN